MKRWMEILCRGSVKLLQGVLRDAAAHAASEDVFTAREQVKAEIQRRRGLPGALRRWLCREVDDVQAATLGEFRTRLDERIGDLAR